MSSNLEMKSQSIKPRSKKKADFSEKCKNDAYLLKKDTEGLDVHLQRVNEEPGEEKQTEDGNIVKEVRKNKRGSFKSYSKTAKKPADQDVHFDLIEHIGSIGASHNGWLREVNILSWNDAEPGLDIRHWSEDHRKMSRGINLSLTECENLRVLLAALDLSPYEEA